MSLFRRAIAVALCLLAIPAVGLAQQRLTLAGQDQTLWLVKSDRGQFQIVAKEPNNAQWKWITSEPQSGTPRACLAMGAQLHLFFTQPVTHMVYDTKGQATMLGRPALAAWENDIAPLDVVDARALADSTLPSLLAVTPRRPVAPEPAAPQPTTTIVPPAQAALTTAPASRAQVVDLAMLINVGGRWEQVALLPGVALAERTTVKAAVVGKRIYLLLHTPDGGPNRLTVHADGQWKDLPVAGPLAQGLPLAMATIQGSPTVLLALPAHSPAATQGQLPWQLQLVKLDSATATPPVPLTRDGQAATWPAGEPPLAAWLQDRLYLVWKEGGELQLATAGQAGQLTAPQRVTAFDAPPLAGQGQKIIDIFLWAVLLAVLAPMFLLRPATPPKPFALPPTLRPASLGRRLLAGLIDFLPLSAVVSIPFRIEVLTFKQMTTMVSQNQLPANIAWWYITVMSVYVVYCILMEGLRGATLGKLALQLRVVADEGVRPGLREVLLRNLVKIIELQFPPLLLFAALSRNRQRLGDMLARTTVVDAVPVAPPAPPPPQDNDPDDPDDLDEPM